jgi:hypothetical protein
MTCIEELGGMAVRTDLGGRNPFAGVAPTEDVGRHSITLTPATADLRGLLKPNSSPLNRLSFPIPGSSFRHFLQRCFEAYPTFRRTVVPAFMRSSRSRPVRD